MLDSACFKTIDNRWGPHAVDRFACVSSRQVARYCSRYLNPGCKAVDTFTVSWEGENNWLFPPPYLVPWVLRHMSVGMEDGSLLVPHWPSAPWWLLLITSQGNWRGFVKDVIELQLYDGIFIPVSAASSVFSSGITPFEVLC